MKTKKGRPTRYKSDYCQQLIKFFDIDPYEDKPLEHFKDGEVRWVDYKRMANKLPTLRNFSKHIKVDISTVYNWINKKHSSFQKDFFDAFTCAKELRKWFLIENGLNGCYNPLFAKFVATNITDLREKTEIEHSGEIKFTQMNDIKVDNPVKNRLMEFNIG